MAWRIEPNKKGNVLFVKPVEKEAHANLNVLTNKRSYVFILKGEFRPVAQQVYSIVFRYPDEEGDNAAMLAQARERAGPFDDGRIRNASYDASEGFGLRVVAGETAGYSHSSEVSEAAIKRAGQSSALAKRGYSGAAAEAIVLLDGFGAQVAAEAAASGSASAAESHADVRALMAGACPAVAASFHAALGRLGVDGDLLEPEAAIGKMKQNGNRDVVR